MCRVGEVAGAGVQVVVAAHRLGGEVQVGSVREPGADPLADEPPDVGVGEFGFDLAGAAIHRDEGFVEQPHEHRIRPPTATPSGIGFGHDVGERVQLRIVEQRLDPLQLRDPARSAAHRESARLRRSCASPSR